MAPDVAAGFSVFLIALPLCLGIALASNFPATAGIVTAIFGGLVCSLLSTSELTIKGPAAGLIVVALSSVNELGQGDAHKGYVLTLGVLVIAALVQVCVALLRLGVIVQSVPPAPVNGMMAAIGTIIAAKQVHFMLGVTPVAKMPLALIGELPQSVANLNPDITLIGATTIVVLIVGDRLRHRFTLVAPALVAVIVTLATNLLFGVVAGIAAEALCLIVFFHVTPPAMFRLRIEVTKSSEELYVLKPKGPLVFTNLHFLRAVMLGVPRHARAIVDLSAAPLVDHAAMTFLRTWNTLPPPTRRSWCSTTRASSSPSRRARSACTPGGWLSGEGRVDCAELTW